MTVHLVVNDVGVHEEGESFSVLSGAEGISVVTSKCRICIAESVDHVSGREGVVHVEVHHVLLDGAEEEGEGPRPKLETERGPLVAVDGRPGVVGVTGGGSGNGCENGVEIEDDDKTQPSATVADSLVVLLEEPSGGTGAALVAVATIATWATA